MRGVWQFAIPPQSTGHPGLSLGVPNADSGSAASGMPRRKALSENKLGWVAEWSNAAVLKSIFRDSRAHRKTWKNIVNNGLFFILIDSPLGCT
jgi:hypothetical protein